MTAIPNRNKVMGTRSSTNLLYSLASTPIHYLNVILTKYPDHGFPAWVTSRKVGSIRRYEASRGFWNDGEPDDEDEASSESAEEDCSKSETVPSQEPSTVKPRPTIEEQVERCGEESIVLLAKTTVDEKTGEVVTKREFIRRLPMSLPAVLEGLPVPTGINNANTCAEFPYIPAITAALR